MENPSKFKLPAYPLPFIHHLDIIQEALDKGDNDLVVDIAQLVQKHLTLRLYEGHRAEFDRLFTMLENTASVRGPSFYEQVSEILLTIQHLVNPPKEQTEMNVEKEESKPLPLRKILIENNMKSLAQKNISDLDLS